MLLPSDLLDRELAGIGLGVSPDLDGAQYSTTGQYFSITGINCP